RQLWRENLGKQLLHELAAALPGLVGSRRKDHQRTGRSVDWRETGGHRAKAALERIWARSIDNSDLYPRTMRIHVLEDRVHADAVTPNVRLGPDLRVDGDDVGLLE